MKKIKVKDLMTKNVITIFSTDTIVNCSKIMNKYDIGFLPVLNKYSDVIGVVTDRDIINNIICKEKDIYSQVLEVISNNIISCNKNDDITTAINKMKEYKVRRLLVIEKNTIKGVLSLSDLTKNPKTYPFVSEILKSITDNSIPEIILFKDLINSIKI